MTHGKNKQVCRTNSQFMLHSSPTITDECISNNGGMPRLSLHQPNHASQLSNQDLSPGANLRSCLFTPLQGCLPSWPRPYQQAAPARWMGLLSLRQGARAHSASLPALKQTHALWVLGQSHMHTQASLTLK